MTDLHSPERLGLLRRARRLEWLTVGWNLVEAVVALGAAMASGSVALLAFGLDSLVETMSGLVILWRLRAERRSTDPAEVARVEDLARRGVAVSLWALAAFVAWDAVAALVSREAPASSPVGVAVLALSVGVMWWLARAKADVGRRMHSHAVEADAAQTDACWRLSIVALAGLVLNGWLGWWWADPVAAIALAALIGREGFDAWRRRGCCSV
jgi:cation diffusion facilitator family transporter